MILETIKPGPIVLFGSGETSTTGRAVFEGVLKQLPSAARIAILETPAGFQPNSALVAQEMVLFLQQRLVNFAPRPVVVPARKRGTACSPDEPHVVQPLYEANAVYLGAGSPTYAAQQLLGSLAWQIVLGKHYLGAALILASAATIAVSNHVLPVYEIYKAGADLHWQQGLDLFQPYGAPMTIIPHWDNREGGDKLDTSRCFMGRERFERLHAMLPADTLCVGIDEHTAFLLDPVAGSGYVQGKGAVTLLHNSQERVLPPGATIPLNELGPFHFPEPGEGVGEDVWSTLMGGMVVGAQAPAAAPEPVMRLVRAREAARASREWTEADSLRRQIADLGWQVRDTGAGPEVTRSE